MKTRLKLLTVVTAVALTGCAGGGGGSGPNPAQEIFCAFLGKAGDCIQKGQAPQSSNNLKRLIASDISETGFSYNTATDGSIQALMTGLGTGPGPHQQVVLDYDSDGRVFLRDSSSWFLGGYRELLGHPGLTIAAAMGIFPSTSSPFLNMKDPAVKSAVGDIDWPTIGVIANPHQLGWSYQSFGIWNSNFPDSGYLNSMTFGGQTTAASLVPGSGTATFTGKMAGFYVSPSGEGSIAGANLTVNADFNSRSLGFTTNGTTLTRNVLTATAAPNLNLSGVLTYSPGSNAFTGTITNAGATMTGTSNGKFYGPAAQELGGVFATKSPTTVEAYTGAYGAKR